MSWQQRESAQQPDTLAAAMASSKQLRALIEEAQIGCFVLDLDGYWRDANLALAKMLGHSSPAELIGTHSRDTVLEEDLHDIAGILAGVARGIPCSSRVVRRRRRDGTAGFYAMDALPLRRGKRVVGVQGLLYDLTEQTRIESALQRSWDRLITMSEAMPIPMVFSRAEDGQILFGNTQLAATFGVPLDELCNHRTVEFYACAADRAALLADLEAKDCVHNREVLVHKADGTPFTVVVSMQKLVFDGQPALLATFYDVTERKQIEDELRQSEEHFRSLCESAPTGVFMTDREGYCTYVNRRLLEISGLTFDDALGHGWNRLVHPEDREHVLEAAEEARRQERSFVEDFRIVTPQGEERWLGVRTTWFAATEKQAAHQVGTVQDITERMRSDRELRKFKSTCEATPHGLAIVDMKGHVRYVNAAWADMHGWRPEESIGRHLSVFHSPEQMPQVNQLIEVLARDGRFADQEVWHRRRDGSTFPTLMDATVVRDEQGRPLCLSGMAVDISDRKKMEETLRQQALLFIRTTDGVIITGEDHLIIEWNPAAEEIFGYRREEVLGKTPEILNRPDEAEAITRRIHEQIARSGYSSGEITFVRKNGSQGICEAFVAPLCDDEGRIRGTISVNKDVTVRKEEEQYRARLQNRLQQVQKMEALGTLASGIAHEFNNLLTAIFGYIEMAGHALAEDHPSMQALRMVKETARQARGTVNSLLTFSRKGSSHKSPIDLAASLQGTLSLLRRLLPPSADFVADIAADSEVWVRADPSQLQQVWVNLVVNARDAMPNGGQVRVSLRTVSRDLDATHGPSRTTHEGAGREACVEVRDTGAGMSEDVRSRIFEPFFTTKPLEQGTGLGMAIAHAIVSDHGGRIDVSSEPGRGTSVCVLLPFCEPPPSKDAAPQPERPGRNETIVVVENNPHIRSIITSSLRAEGYNALPVANLEACMGCVETAMPMTRLIVLDIEPLGAAGSSILEETRRRCPQVPKLVLAPSTDAESPPALEPTEYLLEKPFQVADLVSHVGRLLGRTPHAKQDLAAPLD